MEKEGRNEKELPFLCLPKRDSPPAEPAPSQVPKRFGFALQRISQSIKRQYIALSSPPRMVCYCSNTPQITVDRCDRGSQTFRTPPWSANIKPPRLRCGPGPAPLPLSIPTFLSKAPHGNPSTTCRLPPQHQPAIRVRRGLSIVGGGSPGRVATEKRAKMAGPASYLSYATSRMKMAPRLAPLVCNDRHQNVPR
ncbi:hypothetical protein DM02DRAFT_161053 [Periconia macrospinosa]|uniref:Uncharacterized protein n=1 Tax=Periconia macrospinosa TaxID=97972 RepID=A0A2V1E349_9PLEO|nr:hypothetical protein DM02DRAFT_161053 [Periconia macrospinosa]